MKLTSKELSTCAVCTGCSVVVVCDMSFAAPGAQVATRVRVRLNGTACSTLRQGCFGGQWPWRQSHAAASNKGCFVAHINRYARAILCRFSCQREGDSRGCTFVLSLNCIVRFKCALSLCWLSLKLGSCRPTSHPPLRL